MTDPYSHRKFQTSLEAFGYIPKDNLSEEEYERLCQISETEQRAKYNEMNELIDRDTNITPAYAQNFLPYQEGKSNTRGMLNGISHGNLDGDILTKACQNDIRMLLKMFSEEFHGSFNIKYKNGKVESMIASIEYIGSDNKAEKYESMEKFINGYGFIAHKKYGSYSSTIYGEKIYKYTDENWLTGEIHEDYYGFKNAEVFSYIPKDIPPIKKRQKNKKNL